MIGFRAVALCLLVAHGAHAAPAPSPRAIEAQIHAEGAVKTVAALDAAKQMDAVLDRIGRGDSEWITLAAQLAPGTDGANAEGITIVLAQALPENAASVLRILTKGQNGVLDLNQVCSIPFIETTPAANRAYSQRAIEALSRVAAPDLAARRDACLARLKS